MDEHEELLDARVGGKSEVRDRGDAARDLSSGHEPPEQEAGVDTREELFSLSVDELREIAEARGLDSSANIAKAEIANLVDLISSF